MKELKKRIVAVLSAAAVLATSVVSGGMGIRGSAVDASTSTYKVENLYGSDANTNDGTAYSPQYFTEGELLVGDGSPLYDDSAKKVIQNAEETYALGIASQFCVFLQGDFTLRAADCEGRAAVGENIAFDGDYNYQIGSGDYASYTPLKSTSEYTGITNFAHAIVGGTVTNVNTLSQKGGGPGYFEYENDLFKRIDI